MNKKIWTYYKTFGMYVITNGKKEIKIGYLKDIPFDDLLNLINKLNNYYVDKIDTSFYLTKYANSHSMQLFKSIFVGYQVEEDEYNRINVFSLEYPIAEYIGKINKYINTYFLETN